MQGVLVYITRDFIKEKKVSLYHQGLYQGEEGQLISPGALSRRGRLACITRGFKERKLVYITRSFIKERKVSLYHQGLQGEEVSLYHQGLYQGEEGQLVSPGASRRGS